MGTRSRFGIENSDGTITSVYHHWDGYPSWLGMKLVENYNDEAKIRKVMEKGDISSLESDQDWNFKQLPNKTVRYYSERGEDTPSQTSKNFSEFMNLTQNCGGEYAYLFKDGKWHCYINSDSPQEINIE